MNIVASPVLSNSQQVGFARLDLWAHSLTAALAAQTLATRLGTVQPELAFTAALLHDVGKVVLAQAMGAAYIALIEEARAQSTPMFILERAAYETDHAEVGAKLMKQWNFPEAMMAAIAYHHAPENAVRNHMTLAATVYAANILAYRVGSGYGFPLYAGSPDLAALQGIGFTPQDLFGCEAVVHDAFDRERKRFQI